MYVIYPVTSKVILSKCNIFKIHSIFYHFLSQAWWPKPIAPLLERTLSRRPAFIVQRVQNKSR